MLFVVGLLLVTPWVSRPLGVAPVPRRSNAGRGALGLVLLAYALTALVSGFYDPSSTAGTLTSVRSAAPVTPWPVTPGPTRPLPAGDWPAYGRIAWRHPNGTVRDLSPLPFRMGVPNLGGQIVTASGLAFLSGTPGDALIAYALPR